MSVTGLVFLVNKVTREIKLAGEVPAAYGNITGLNAVDYSVLKDLGQSFPDEDDTYKNLGFLTEADALQAGVPAETITNFKLGAWELKWNSLEEERFNRIEDQRWRVNRHNDEVALNLPVTEDITPVLQYMQAIRDLPATYPDPFNMVWPTVPPLPA